MKKGLLLIFALFNLFAYAQNGLDFDGTNDYVSAISGGPSGTSDRTVECWIKTSTSISSQQVLIDWGTMVVGTRFTLNIIGNGKLRIEVGGSGIQGTTNVADGQWHHVAVTYNNAASTKFNLYIDGTLETSGNTTVSVNTAATGGFQFGRRNDGNNYFDGIIDEIRIWNIARTASDISNHMNAEFCGPETGLVAYFKMNQGTAGMSNTGLTTLTDAVGINHGTLNNFALTGSGSNWVTGASLSSGSASAPTNAALTVCDSYTAQNGSVWTTSGNYVDTLTNVHGCDSVVNIALTVNSSSSGTLTATGCNKYTGPSGNQTWTTSGTVYDTLQSANGCDSILTITLTINTIDTTVLANGAFLTSYANNATYQWLDCNNGFMPIAGATTQTFKATANGSYAVEINDNGCIDTSACYDVTTIGINENILEAQLSIYPNPADDYVTLNLTNSYNHVEITFVNSAGVLVYRVQKSNTNKVALPLQLPSGVYSIVVNADGIVANKKFIILN